jgi:hypothetical protein
MFESVMGMENSGTIRSLALAFLAFMALTFSTPGLASFTEVDTFTRTDQEKSPSQNTELEERAALSAFEQALQNCMSNGRSRTDCLMDFIRHEEEAPIIDEGTRSVL